MLDRSQPLYTVLRILVLQVLVTVVLTLVCSITSDPGKALSALVGGCIASLGSGWMVLVVFRRQRDPSPERLISSLYIGEIGKFLFVMAFFALAFKKLAPLARPENALVMFLAFLLVQAVIWLWPWLDLTGRAKNK